MKKLAAILFATVLLCGCSSKNSSSSIPTVAPNYEGIEAPTDESGTIDWATPYNTVIQDFRKTAECNDTARFSIYDMNDDRLPELIISYGEPGNRSYLLYTIYDDMLTSLGNYAGYSELCLIMERNLIATFAYQDNVQDVQLYREKNDKFANVGSFQRTNDLNVVDDQEVTSDEYDAEYKRIFHGVLKQLGRDHGFYDDVINAALGRCDDWKEAYASVMRDYLKTYDDDQFSLFDITGDGVPELFVSGGYRYAPYVDIYAWNGCPVPIGTFGADGTLHYYADRDEILCAFDGPSYSSGSFVKLNDVFKFDQLFSYGDNVAGVKPEKNEKPSFYIDAELVEKESYLKSVNEKLKGDPYLLGQDNDLTQEAIDEFLKGHYKTPETKQMDMKS